MSTKLVKSKNGGGTLYRKVPILRPESEFSIDKISPVTRQHWINYFTKETPSLEDRLSVFSSLLGSDILKGVLGSDSKG